MRVLSLSALYIGRICPSGDIWYSIVLGCELTLNNLKYMLAI